MWHAYGELAGTIILLGVYGFLIIIDSGMSNQKFIKFWHPIFLALIHDSTETTLNY